MNALLLIAHPDDEIMMYYTLKNIVDLINHLDILVALHGINARMFGFEASTLWDEPAIAAKNIARIRDLELRKSIERFGFNSYSIHYLELPDLGWKKGGLQTVDHNLPELIKKHLLSQPTYEIIIGPFTLPPQQSPSTWSHPDHEVLSHSLDTLVQKNLLHNTTILRYIFYNELTPFSSSLTPQGYRIAKKYLSYDDLLRRNKHIERCYPSQKRTLYKILGKASKALINTKWDQKKSNYYANKAKNITRFQTKEFTEIILFKNLSIP